MRAMSWHGRNDLRVGDVPNPPPPKEGEVTIKVDWCGLCGTDIEEYRGGPLYIPTEIPNPLTGAIAPLIMGHELVGTIAEVGKGVTNLKVGDRIAPDPIIFCGECPNCISHNVHHCDNMAHLGLTTHGGFAEYVNTISKVCFKLPSDVPSEWGTLSEPAAVCVRAIRLAKIDIGHSLVIIGAGSIGLLTLQLAKMSGAYPIYMVQRSKGIKDELAMQMGADKIIHSADGDPVEILKELTDGRLVDRVIECGGNPATIDMANRICGRRGRVVITGLHNGPIDTNYFPLVWDEIEVIGSFSHIYDIDFKIAVELIGRKMLDISPLITKKISLENVIKDGIEEFMNNTKNHVKIMASPHLAG
jgi:(R,R)-butanediol dehydrogenase/meso-butanediol dehydrogenase/diacetyl reductase